MTAMDKIDKEIDKEMEAAKQRLALLYGEKVAKIAIGIFDDVVVDHIITAAHDAGVPSAEVFAALLDFFRAFDQVSDDCASKHSKN